MKKRSLIVSLVLVVLLVGALGVSAQGDTPSVDVSDQLVLGSAVWINAAYSEGPGFVVIHIDNGEGAPGPVIGQRSIGAGWTRNFSVPIDAALATPTMFAMLHLDDNEVGVYEFGTVEGADAPVFVNDAVVAPPLTVQLLSARDQLVSGNTVTIDAVIAAQPSWVVIHSGDANAPGPVLGQFLVEPGLTTDLQIGLEGAATNVIWPMLHVDDGAVGEYEFGLVEGADAPVVVDGRVATFPVWTVPSLRVSSQAVIGGDNSPLAESGSASAPTLTVAAVLSDGPGFVVIHQDADNAPGPVAGFVAVPDGFSENLVVDLDPALVTPILWPMLHVDDNTLGTYEFGTVAGADAPVSVDDQVVTFPIGATPSLNMQDQAPEAGEAAGTISVTVDEAVMDAPGWLAIHSNADGAPGPVLTNIALSAGSNRDIVFELDAAAAGNLIFPMLHYDTGEIGVYEFGTVEGADPPVFFNGEVVVAPLNLLTAGASTGGNTCVVTGTGSGINRRSGPDTAFPVVGRLDAGATATADAQTVGADTFTWYRLTDSSWVRSDVVTAEDSCANLELVIGPAAPPPAPAATQEAVPAATQDAAAPPPAQPTQPAPAATEASGS